MPTKQHLIAFLLSLILYFSLSSSLVAQHTKTEEYAILGKVWGFLKYYHPQVSQKKLAWDQALIAAIAHLDEKGTINSALQEMLDLAGPIPTCKKCPPAFSEAQMANLDWRWMEDEMLLQDDI